MRHGIFSNSKVAELRLSHVRIDNEEVNERRQKVLPNGRPLHDYANLFFNCRNAMMYSLVLGRFKECRYDLCVLGIEFASLYSKPGVLASDMIAARVGAKIQPIASILPELDRKNVFLRDWRDADPKKHYVKKSWPMAEVLVPERVVPEMITTIFVGTYFSSKQLLERFPQCPLEVKLAPSLFFEAWPGSRV